MRRRRIAIKMRWTVNWRTLISGCLLIGCLGCTTAPAIHLLPNDRDLQPVYDEAGKLVQGRSSIADGYLREIEQRLSACQQRKASEDSDWTVVSVPPELFKCTIRGTVYAESGKIDPPKRTDGCVMIRHDVDGNGLTLRYSGIWVLIPFPTSGGHVPFAYRWGSPVATIAGREVPIAWGRE